MATAAVMETKRELTFVEQHIQFKSEFRAANPAIAEDLRQDIDALDRSGFTKKSNLKVQVGSPLPAGFSLERHPAQQKQSDQQQPLTVSSKDLFESSKSLAIVFIRSSSWCPHCNIHLLHLQSVYSKMKEQEGELVVIVPEHPRLLRRQQKSPEDKDFVEKSSTKIEFPILLDEEHNFSTALGFTYGVPEKTLATFTKFGISLVSSARSGQKSLPVTATIIIDSSSQNVTQLHAEADYTNRFDPLLIVEEMKRIREHRINSRLESELSTRKVSHLINNA